MKRYYLGTALFQREIVGTGKFSCFLRDFVFNLKTLIDLLRLWRYVFHVIIECIIDEKSSCKGSLLISKTEYRTDKSETGTVRKGNIDEKSNRSQRCRVYILQQLV